MGNRLAVFEVDDHPFDRLGERSHALGPTRSPDKNWASPELQNATQDVAQEADSVPLAVQGGGSEMTVGLLAILISATGW